ncbi:rhomboid family protein [Sporobolomyces salmoneus]|uniref:rhomboid family protein n=1 Tax=Sporobolomyces salmoneus TaxID=183962 RepID=UPI003181EA31
MSRRQGSPPTGSGTDYLRQVPSQFAVPPPQSSSHDHAYTHSQPAVLPSDLYSRPVPPSDVASSNFEWSEDAASTIAPDDSVSQLDRRFTGRRGLFGPRPIPGNNLPPPVPEIPEELALEETVHRDYVPPEMLKDDRSTVVLSSSNNRSSGQTNSGIRERGMNENSSVGPLARARGEGSGSGSGPVPYTSRQYDDEDEDAPLVANNAPRRIDQNSNGSQSTVHPYSRPKGYAAIGGVGDGRGNDHSDQDNDDDDSYYPKRGLGGRDAERGDPDDYSPEIKAVGGGGAGLVGSLMSRLRGGGANRRQESSFYAPNELAFEPPQSSSVDRNSSYPPTLFGMDRSQSSGLHKIPSLDVAGAHDRTGSEKYIDASGIRPEPLWKRWFWDTTDPARRVWEHKQSMGIQRWPYASWLLAAVMTIVMIVELVKMKSITGSVIQTKPSFNYMIGPSGAVLINQGARFAGCMNFIKGVTDIQWTCLNQTNSATLSSSDPTCTMSEICGFGGFEIVDGPGGPDQTFRFFVPIFLHAGILHLLVNMAVQCFGSTAQVEKMMGTPKFIVLYLAAGIFGFVLGSNFALVGQPSVGASGAIFGTHAALLYDLAAHWKIEYQPKRKLFWIVVEIIVGFGLGWVPGIDNFAHLGGFAMGLVLSFLLFPVVHSPSRTHKYIFYGLRIVALPLAIVMFVVLVKLFQTEDPSTACSWCRYLSCWPTAQNNRCKGTGLSTVTASSSSAFSSLFTIIVSTFLLALV